MKKNYLFRSVDIVPVCNSFVIVATVGRCYSCEEDSGQFWMYGIHPGAMAAGVDHFNETILFGEFFAKYGNILRDIATRSESVEAFEIEVKRFVLQGSECESDHSTACNNVNCMTKEVEIYEDSADAILETGIATVHRSIEESPDIKDLFLGNLASIANDFLQYPEGSQERIAAETVVTVGHALRVGADLGAFSEATRGAQSWLESVFSPDDESGNGAAN